MAQISILIRSRSFLFRLIQFYLIYLTTFILFVLYFGIMYT